VISVTPRPDGRYDYAVRDWFRKYDSISVLERVQAGEGR